MPKFYKNRRYVNKQGKKFGKGVWVDDDGTIIYPGQGKTLDRKNNTITQYNSDGTKTTYPWEQWAKKNQTDHEVRVLQNDRKYAIPVVPEKMMTITLDEDSPTRHAAGATFSENLLDSIAVNAKKAGLPFSTGLGIASQESALSQGERGEGKSMLPWNRLLNVSTGEMKKSARNISYKGYYSPSLLISNWKQRQEGPFYKYNYNSQGYLLDSPKSDEFYDADINAARREANKYHLEEESPLEHGFRKYKEDPTSWNPKDPDYPKKVKEKAEELTKYSPEIRAYMQKNNLHAEGGYLNAPIPWNELPISQRAEIMREAVNNGIYNLQDVRDAYHNNLFGGGGYMPSKAIKQRIAEWEGSSMYKAAPDTGKVNRSFEAEAKDFNRVIPASIRARLSQEQLDALYSYGYNVGMGKLKERVLPTLTNYINGSAGAEDVASSMWASRDNEPKMGGLRRRRAYERNQFIYGSPSERRQSVVTSALNMDLSNLPSELSQEDLQQLYLANPTDYGTPVDYSTPTRPIVEAPIEEDNTQPSGMGIFNLMSDLGMFGNTKQEAPIASYTPVKNSNPYVVSMPTNNSTLLDASWFADGGPIDLGYNSKAYEEWKASLPKNLRKETPEYDLYGAYKAGLQPHLEEDGYYHLGSRDPKTNRLLKKPSHPTYPLAILADAQEGYLASPYDKKTDSVYTYPLPWIKCNGGHLFNDGGDTITDAASGNVYYGVEDVVNPNQLVVNPDGSVTTVNGVTGAVSLPATTITGYRDTDDRIKAALNNIVKENPAQISSIPSIALSATGDLIKGGANAVVNAFGLPDVAPASNPADIKDGDALLDYTLFAAPYAREVGVTKPIETVMSNVWHHPLAQYPRYYAGKLYYGRDVELPTMYRKLRDVPEVRKSKIQISPIDNRFGFYTGEESPLITNMSTDVPVRTNAGGDWNDADVLAFPGKALLGKRVVSTKPSDTFTYGNMLNVSPKRVTYISGRPDMLAEASSRGMNTITSQVAQEAANKAVPHTDLARIFMGENWGPYADELQNLSRISFRSPTERDYKFMDWVFQPKYKSEVYPYQDLTQVSLSSMNTLPEPLQSILGDEQSRRYLLNPKEWKNVLYDPASDVESLFRYDKGIDLKDNIPAFNK